MIIILQHESDHILNLIFGCHNNDRRSQHILYKHLFDYGLKISYRYIHQQEEAEEILHEAFIKFFKNIHRFEISREGNTEALLKGWFKRIVVNTCIDQLRKVHLNIINLDDDSNLQVLNREQQESGFDKLAYYEIIDSIKQLTPVYRAVFNLFVIEGFSHEEIAKILGISIGASKSNLSKAKTNLRKILLQRNMHTNYV